MVLYQGADHRVPFTFAPLSSLVFAFRGPVSRNLRFCMWLGLQLPELGELAWLAQQIDIHSIWTSCKSEAWIPFSLSFCLSLE